MGRKSTGLNLHVLGKSESRILLAELGAHQTDRRVDPVENRRTLEALADFNFGGDSPIDEDEALKSRVINARARRVDQKKSRKVGTLSRPINLSDVGPGDRVIESVGDHSFRYAWTQRTGE